MCTRFSNEEICNICANYVIEKDRRVITDEIQVLYLDIYGECINEDFYAPSTICDNCVNSLKNFAKGN